MKLLFLILLAVTNRGFVLGVVVMGGGGGEGKISTHTYLFIKDKQIRYETKSNTPIPNI
jgi:hypothetical protein